MNNELRAVSETSVASPTLSSSFQL